MFQVNLFISTRITKMVQKLDLSPNRDWDLPIAVGLSRSWALQNGWTDRDAVWNATRAGRMEPCIRWGSRSTHVKWTILRAKGVCPEHARTCPRQSIKAPRRGAEPVRRGCRLGCTRWRCTLAQRGEYDWIVRVRRLCGLMSNYFDHLFIALRLKKPLMPIVQTDVYFTQQRRIQTVSHRTPDDGQNFQ